VNQQDRSFLKSFSAMLGGLAVITVVVVVIARVVTGVAEQGSTARLAQEAALLERIKPVGTVALVGDEPAPEAGGDSGGDELTAQEVVTSVCAACHQAGVLEAPKIGAKEDWEPRLEAGLDMLVSNAINGLNAMPARGGNPNLSDDEIRASVLLILADSGIDTGESVPTDEAAGATAGEAVTSAAPVDSTAVDAAGLYAQACAACHDTGAANAPKTGDQAAWAERIGKGLDTLVDHAVNGFNAMPAKGGAAQLSDVEVAATVEYMVENSK